MSGVATAPKPGVDYRVVLGDSLVEAGTSTSNSYAVLRYDFKPASVDRSRQGTVQVVQDRRQLLYSLPTVNADEPDIDYQGRFDQGNELDCVAIFDGKGGFRLERLLGQAYLRHSNSRKFSKRESTTQNGHPQTAGSSPEGARAAPDETKTHEDSAQLADKLADMEVDAELEAELTRGLLEEEDEPEPEPMKASKPASPPPLTQEPAKAALHSTSHAAPKADVKPFEHSNNRSDNNAGSSPGTAAVPGWTGDATKVDTITDAEREFLGIPAANQLQKPAPDEQPHSPSSSSSSSDSSSSDSDSSSDSSDDDDIHKCSDDESEGKDVEWF